MRNKRHCPHCRRLLRDSDVPGHLARCERFRTRILIADELRRLEAIDACLFILAVAGFTILAVQVLIP